MKQTDFLGAIIGDTIGSIYEFNPTKEYGFKMYDPGMEFTDDSIMTVAVADWILNGKLTETDLIEKIQTWGRKYRYPMGSYGCMFSEWIDSNTPTPYNSWGNGSAMRVSAVGFAFDTLQETLDVAKLSAQITHNHPEGIKGAQATAAAIFMARKGNSKEEIRQYISSTFSYNLNRRCTEIRKNYSFKGSCQETVPESIIAFLDSNCFEDSIRLAISLGGDADTIGAINGAIAAAFYKTIPNEIYNFVWSKLTPQIKDVILKFGKKINI